MLATLDDRGKAVRSFRLGYFRRPGNLPPLAFKRALRLCGHDPRVFVVAIAAGVTAAVCALVALSLLPRRGVGLVIVPICMVPGFVPYWLLNPHIPRLAWKRWVQAIEGCGHCPSCAHALHGLPVADDGCRVCPECGAAWKPRQRPSPGSHADGHS